MSQNTNAESSWHRSLMTTCDLLLMTNTYALLILALIVIDLPRCFGLQWAEVALVSFVTSILAGVLAIPVRLFMLSGKSKRRRMLSGVIVGAFSIILLGFDAGIIAVAGFAYSNLIVIR